MHERTERALCRLAFLLLCALPTLLTFAAVMVTRTPWYHRAEIAALEVLLQQRLGLSVAIAEMTKPTPGEWQLEGVRLSDPETGAEVARVRTVIYAVAEGRSGIYLEQPELRSDQFPLSWRLVHDRFLCQPELIGSGLRLRAKDLSIHNQLQGLTLSPVDVRIEPQEQDTLATVRFALAGRPAGEAPAMLRVTRDRSGTAPRTHVSLATGSSPLPCNVLADYLPVMRLLGSDAQFAGQLRWELGHDDYTVQLQGAKFTDVNMLDLFELFDYRLSGMGTIEIQSLTRHRGRPVSEAIGRIAITDAKVEPDLLRAVQSLGVLVDPQALEEPGRINCQSVAFGFQLHGAEMQLSGLCHRQPHFESMQPGTAVVVNNRPLAHIEPNRPLSTVAFNEAINPRGRVALPVGPGGDWPKTLLPRIGERDAADDQPPAVPRVWMAEQPR